MRRKKRDKLMLLLVLLLAISVGYAALSTTLKINGTTSISTNTWGIYWDVPVVTQGSVSNILPTNDAIKEPATIPKVVNVKNLSQFGKFNVLVSTNGSAGTRLINKIKIGKAIQYIGTKVETHIAHDGGLLTSTNEYTTVEKIICSTNDTAM